MLGLRLLRFHIIRHRCCSLTSPTTSRSLLAVTSSRDAHTSSIANTKRNPRAKRAPRPRRELFDRRTFMKKKVDVANKQLDELMGLEFEAMTLRQIIDKLDFSDGSVGPILLKHAMSLVQKREWNPKEYTQQELATLISLGGSDGIVKLDMRKNYTTAVCSIIEKRGGKLGIDVWNAKYETEYKNGKKLEVMMILEDLVVAELEPNLKTYEIMTKIYADEHKFYEITEIIEHMKELDMKISNQILENLIYASTVVGGEEAGLATLNEITSKHRHHLNIFDIGNLYLALARGVSINGGYHDVIRVLNARRDLMHAKDLDASHLKIEEANRILWDLAMKYEKEEEGALKKLISFMRKNHLGAQFLKRCNRMIIEQKAAEVAYHERDIEKAYLLISLLKEKDKGLTNVLGAIFENTVDEHYTIDDIMKYSDLLKKMIPEIKYPLVYFIDTFINTYFELKWNARVDPIIMHDCEMVIQKLFDRFFESSEYLTIGHRPILNRMKQNHDYKKMEKQAMEKKRQQREKLQELFEARSMLSVEKNMPRSGFIKGEVVYDYMAELLAKKNKMKEEEKAQKADQETEKMSEVEKVVTKDLMSELLAAKKTETPTMDQAPAQTSNQEGRIDLLSEMLSTIRKKADRSTVKNEATKDLMSELLSSKQAKTETGKDLMSELLAAKQGGSEARQTSSSYAPDPSSLDALKEQATGLYVQHLRNPASIPAIEVARLLAYILDENVKYRTIGPYRCKVMMGRFLNLKLNPSEKNSIKTDFDAWMTTAVELALGQGKKDALVKLMNLRAKHGISIPPNLMLKYAEIIQENPPNDGIVVNTNLVTGETTKTVLHKTHKTSYFGSWSKRQDSQNASTTQLNDAAAPKEENMKTSTPATKTATEVFTTASETASKTKKSEPKPIQSTPTPPKKSTKKSKVQTTQEKEPEKIEITHRRLVPAIPRGVLIDKLADEVKKSEAPLDGPIEDMDSFIKNLFDYENRPSEYYHPDELLQKQERELASWPPTEADFTKVKESKKELAEIKKCIENAHPREAFEKAAPQVRKTNDIMVLLEVLILAVKQKDLQVLEDLRSEYSKYKQLYKSSTYPLHLATAFLVAGDELRANQILERHFLRLTRTSKVLISTLMEEIKRPDVLHKLFLRFYDSKGTEPNIAMALLPDSIRLYGLNDDLHGLITLKRDLIKNKIMISPDDDLLLVKTIETVKSRPRSSESSSSSPGPYDTPTLSLESKRAFSTLDSSKMSNITHETVFPRTHAEPEIPRILKREVKMTYPSINFVPDPEFYPYRIAPKLDAMSMRDMDELERSDRGFSLFSQMKSEGHNEK